MSVCGLWPGPRRLYAVIDDNGQLRRPITAHDFGYASQCLLEWLATSDIHIVVVSEHFPSLIAQALAAKLPVALAPHPLLEAIRRAAGLTYRPPHHTAALLARWHSTPGLRSYLRLWHPSDFPTSQLPLLE